MRCVRRFRPYVLVGMKVLERAAGHSPPAVIDVEAFAVRTNNSVCGEFRWASVNQAQYAMEGAMDACGQVGISGWETAPTSWARCGAPEHDGRRRRVRRLHRVEAAPRAAASVVHHLSGAPHLARFDDVAVPHLPAADADLLRRAGPSRLPSRTALGSHRSRGTLRTPSCSCAPRTPRRRSRAGGTARSCAGRPFEHLHAHRRVRAGVTDHPRPQCGELSVGFARRR